MIDGIESLTVPSAKVKKSGKNRVKIYLTNADNQIKFLASEFLRLVF